MNKHLFHAYLALVCWIPLPLASGSVWAQNIFIAWATALGLLGAWQVATRSARPPSLLKAAPAGLLFGLSLLWIAVQLVPLPAAWVEHLSPMRIQYGMLASSPSSLTLSFYPQASGHALLLGLAYLQLFMLTPLLIHSEKRLRTFLYTVVMLGVLQALYGGLMTLSGIEKQLWLDKTIHLGTATGTLVNRNQLANYLAYSAAAAIGLLLSSAKTGSLKGWRQWLRTSTQWLLGSKGMLRIALVIIVIGLILTRSRMGNTAFFCSLTSTMLIWSLLSQQANKTILLLFISLLVIDVILIGTWFGIDELVQRIESTSSEKELRYQMLPYIFAMAQDFWLTGTGAGTFAETFLLYNPEATHLLYSEAHLDYLQFLIEFGLLGSLPLGLVVVWSVLKTFHAIRHRRSRLLVASGFAILMALTASGIHALVEYNLQRPATAALFVIFLALPWVIAHLVSDKRIRYENNL